MSSQFSETVNALSVQALEHFLLMNIKLTPAWRLTG
jgi:hypothetical protein